MKGSELQWTNEERRQLYVLLKENVDAGVLAWNAVLQEALKRNTSEHYLENFRTGRIARRDAVQIHEFIKRSHPKIANEFGSRFHSPPAWEAFVFSHRKLGFLELQPPEHAQSLLRMPVRDREAHSSLSIINRPALIEFHLNQTLQWVECAVALYAVEGHWFPMLLQPMEIRKSGSIRTLIPVIPAGLITSVSIGQQRIHSSSLWRSNHTGLFFRFVMLVGVRELLKDISSLWIPECQYPGSELNTYPHKLAAANSQWALHQINTAIGPPR